MGIDNQEDPMHYSYADVIFNNGKIITCADDEKIVEAVAAKDGMILGIGSDAEINKYKGSVTNVVDLENKTMIPGLIDTHNHLDLCGMTASDLVVDCHIPPLKNIDELLDRLKARVHKTPKGKIVFGQGGFDQPHPKKEQLDRIAPESPIIYRNHGHEYTLNTCALQKFGITKDYPTPDELFKIEPGAIILRDTDTKEPTGNIIDGWNFLFPDSKSREEILLLFY